MKFNITALKLIIQNCSDLSKESRLTAEQRADVKTHGENLQAQAHFLEDRTKIAENIDNAIKRLNKELSNDRGALLNISLTIENIRGFVKLLQNDLQKAALLMTSDNLRMTLIIERCFEFSMDGRLTTDQKGDFLDCGKKLRDFLLVLLSSKFVEGTRAIEEANIAIKQINSALADEANSLNNIASTIANIAHLVKSLDELVKLASSFCI